MISAPWRIRLGRIAEQDIRQIFLWTHDRFGVEQARRYRGLILGVIRALTDGPDVLGSREVPEVLPGAKILHIARGGQRGRHLLLYKVESENW
ncbi:type II toxin-antitoxin system RelE/ParE family toxin [Edaphosphingomonas haloaromaticamans]|uniref:Type II toxin-antitoxin system RelE/ParE family toxin n=1 Tax=Edaphosphingomonas haloaromaticamans TaxID=653954 RepID=A0A1S1HIT0_9SPHN|nr:type II toxin-antitoxin system RelE/ParE family toxin [Sphingomonas haloaromaticamans]OHT21752.1 hypothetical protein BHE75_03763 [Sphingomonas haloaromaticamans]